MQCGKAGLMAQLCVNASSLQTEESDHNQSQSSMSIHPYLPDGSGYWPLHKSPGTTILFFLKWDHNCWAAWFVNCTDQCHWSPLTLIESHVTDLPPYIYPNGEERLYIHQIICTRHHLGFDCANVSGDWRCVGCQHFEEEGRADGGTAIHPPQPPCLPLFAHPRLLVFQRCNWIK